MYAAVFSRRARKALLRLSKIQAHRIKDAISDLSTAPRSHGTIQLRNAPVAQYRRRVGGLRILFDINDDERVIEILDIRSRDERTYR